MTHSSKECHVVRDAEKPSIAIYFEHLFPESRGGGERLYGTLAQRWAERGAPSRT